MATQPRPPSQAEQQRQASAEQEPAEPARRQNGEAQRQGSERRIEPPAFSPKEGSSSSQFVCGNGEDVPLGPTREHTDSPTLLDSRPSEGPSGRLPASDARKHASKQRGQAILPPTERLQIHLENYRSSGLLSFERIESYLVVRIKNTSSVFLFSEPLAEVACLILYGLQHSVRRILLLGEKGRGKSYMMKFIMALHSDRCAWINCAALPENLVERELFGHTENTFSDAGRGKDGLLKGKSIVLLDELGTVSVAAQAKILELLEDFTWRPLGSRQSFELPKKEAMILATMNIDANAAVQAKTLRADLLQRFQCCRTIPPLEARGAALIPLVESELSRRKRKPLSQEAKQFISDGLTTRNMRDLSHIIDAACDCMEEEFTGAECPQELLASYLKRAAEAHAPTRESDSDNPTGKHCNDRVLLSAFCQAEGNVEEAAAKVGCSSRTLKDRISFIARCLKLPKLKGLMALTKAEELLGEMKLHGAIFVEDLLVLAEAKTTAAT